MPSRLRMLSICLSVFLCRFRVQNTARKINWTSLIPPVCLFLRVGIMFIGDKLTQCDLRSLKLRGALLCSPLRVWSCSGSRERCHATVFFLSSYFLSSSRLDLNRAIGVKLSLPVQNVMLLTSYSCDDFCCSFCAVFAFYTPGLCHRTKTFMYMRGGESREMRDLFSHLLGDLWAAEKPVLKDFILLFPK